MAISIFSRSVVFVALLAGCGGSNPPPATPDTPIVPDAGDTVADAAPPTAATAAPADTSTAQAAPPAAPKKINVKKNDAAWASCHSSFKAKSKNLSNEVGKLAQGCASLTKMKMIGTTFTGKQTETSPHQEFKLKGVAGHCYRVYAESESTITDLDLMIKDSAGNVGAEDSTDDTTPVLAEDGAVCFSADDDALVVVSVGQGKGSYAVQVWGD